MDVADELNEHLRHAIAQDPLRALTEVASFKAALAALEREAVFAALATHSWRSIGQALGVSKQAAFQRFGREWAVSKRAVLSKQEWREEARRRLRD
jgi:hypothetical protein